MLVSTWDVNDRLWSQATDHLGTPTVARSWSGDQEVRRNTPFGATRSAASTVAGGPSDLSFTGQRDDVGTGLLYFGAGYYDPLLGQFTQPDTAEDGLNRYGYAYNNPLRMTDPTGEWGFDTIKKAVGSAGSVVKEAAVWAYHNPDVVAAALGTAALVANPAGAAFLVLTVGAVAFGAIDTYRSCKGGVTFGCGVSAVTTVATAGTAKWARVASRAVETTEGSLRTATAAEKAAQSTLKARQAAPARLRGWAQATIPQFSRLADTAAGRVVGQAVSRAERFRVSVAQQQAARAAAERARLEVALQRSKLTQRIANWTGRANTAAGGAAASRNYYNRAVKTTTIRSGLGLRLQPSVTRRGSSVRYS